MPRPRRADEIVIGVAAAGCRWKYRGRGPLVSARPRPPTHSPPAADPDRARDRTGSGSVPARAPCTAPRPHGDRRADARDAAQPRAQLGARQRAARPRQVDLEAAAQADAAHLARWPRRRQRRQQVDLAGVALRQHLDDAGGGAEVAVDLERRVGVEQVGVDAAAAAIVRRAGVDEGEQPRQQLERALAIEQPRPLVDLPGQAPAGALRRRAARAIAAPRRTAPAWPR